MVVGVRHPLSDQSNGAVQIPECVTARDPQNAIPAFNHVTVSGCIVLGPVTKIMGAAVDLDH
jgi:hypothetical protein